MVTRAQSRGVRAGRATVVLVLALAACGGPPGTPRDPTAEIEAMLRASAAAWNRGDLDAFMADYARDARTGFVAEGRVQRGFDWIRDRYAPAFAPGAARDSLRFERVEARPLGADYALATARYVLLRGDSVTGSGPFTLVLHRTAEGWKILHDHTSRD